MKDNKKQKNITDPYMFLLVLRLCKDISEIFFSFAQDSNVSDLKDEVFFVTFFLFDKRGK